MVKAKIVQKGDEALSYFVTAPSLTGWDEKEWEWETIRAMSMFNYV